MGVRPTRRVREEYRVYFDRNATKNGAKRSGSGGMHRRPNAAWVLPQAAGDRAARHRWRNRIEDQEKGTATFPVHGVLGGGDAWSSSALSCLKS